MRKKGRRETESKVRVEEKRNVVVFEKANFFNLLYTSVVCRKC